MTDVLRRMLYPVFGNDTDNLTEGEAAAAERVFLWCKGKPKGAVAFDINTAEVRAASKAVRKSIEVVSGNNWEVFSSKSRMRELVELRYIALSVFHTLIPNAPKRRIARILDIDLDRSTVVYGIKVCAEWVKGDRFFRRKYDLVLMLAKAGMQGGDIEKIYSDLNR